MNTNLATMDFSAPVGSLESYVYRINQIPMLTAEEEHSLAEEFHDNHNPEAARQLVLPHLRYVARVARGYLGYGLALGDLIQEGNLGLMKAVQRFDPAFGVRLVSFAVHWIKAEIHEFVLKNWRIVKVATTKAQRKLFFNLRSFKKRLGWFTHQEVKSVADDLNVSIAEVLRMEQRLNAMDATYDPPADSDDDGAYRSPVGYLADHAADPADLVETTDASTQNNEQLAIAMQQLDERAIDILKQRWLNENKATLHELAAQYGVSAERIRQLEQNAMKKIRKAIANHVSH